MEYKITVDYGVDTHSIDGLSHYEMNAALEQLRSWFPNIGFTLDAEPEPARNV